MEELVRYNLGLFADKDTELSKTQTAKMKIGSSDHKPIKLKLLLLRDQLLAANVIQPSRSPWSFPLVIVDKKDGSKRFFIDFRKLNLISKTSSWPLPVIDDMVAVLGKAEIFTTLYLKSGYWQIPIDENDKVKTAFICHSVMYGSVVFGML